MQFWKCSTQYLPDVDLPHEVTYLAAPVLAPFREPAASVSDFNGGQPQAPSGTKR